jgi:hypothetical protein
MYQRLSILPSRNASDTRGLGRGQFEESSTVEATIMSAEVPDGFAAALGIDWADRQHDICMQESLTPGNL